MTRSSKPLVLATCLALVAVVGVIDAVTGSEVRAFPLYFVPIALAGQRLTRASTLAVVLLCTLAWFMANVMFGDHPTTRLVSTVNVAAQTIAFTTVGLLIVELKARLERERDLSRRDPLTGLRNARGFDEQAEVLLALARRAGRPFTLAYIDLDNFKKVNDEQGHHVGDEALRAAARVLEQGTRETDVLARLGGDEFAVFFPDTDQRTASALLERIRAALAAEMARGGWPITATIGAAAFERAPATLDEAVRAGDERMYAAKRAGKNCVVSDTVAPRDTRPAATRRPSTSPASAP